MKNLIVDIGLLMGFLSGCNHSNTDPKPVLDLNNIELIEFDEPDDSGGARVAADQITKENTVYQVVQVTGSCEEGAFSLVYGLR